VGYLLSFYADEVYGEDEGQYYLQKMLDTVVSLEKQGRAIPLASFYPERYECFTLHFGQYLIAKATVLFHIIENKIGGKDPMRLALKQMIKAPPLFAVTQVKTKAFQLMSIGEEKNASVDVSETSSRFDSSSTCGSSFWEDSPDALNALADGAPYTSRAGYQSPFHFCQDNMSPYIPNAPDGSSPADHVAGALRASAFSPSPLSDAASGNGIELLGLIRQHSITSVEGWETDLQVFASDCFTAESFILTVRHASEASTDLYEGFLERYVYRAEFCFCD